MNYLQGKIDPNQSQYTLMITGPDQGTTSLTLGNGFQIMHDSSHNVYFDLSSSSVTSTMPTVTFTTSTNRTNSTNSTNSSSS